jgi:hypothetical protein
MRRRVLLLLHELAHEVAQKLRAAAVARLGGRGERSLQRVIDAKGKGGFAHVAAALVLQVKCNITQRRRAETVLWCRRRHRLLDGGDSGNDPSPRGWWKKLGSEWQPTEVTLT